MRAKDDRKATPGITELSQARVHIDLEACYFAVGSSHPGYAQTRLSFLVRKETRGKEKNILRGDKDPRSPSCKLCPLGIGDLKRIFSAVGKPLNGPPGEYGRKAET